MFCHWHKTCCVFLEIRRGVGNGSAHKRLCFLEFIYNFSNYFWGFSSFKNSKKPVRKMVNRLSDSTRLLFSYKIVKLPSHGLGLPGKELSF
jgi:hypothetical protein